MTLSRFLRDFLYIPLGGNRKGKWKTYRNLMLTMVLGGLWHGAAWTFVLWGAFHGAGLCRSSTRSAGAVERVPAWLRWVVTFHLVVFGWILFRSQSLRLAGDVPLAPVRARARPTLWTAPVVARDRGRDRAAAAAGAAGRALPGADRAPRARSLLGAGLAVVIAVRRRDRVRARASPRSSTSASRDAAHRRRQPDEPLRPARSARASARATAIVARARVRARCWSLFEGDVGCGARASR